MSGDDDFLSDIQIDPIPLDNGSAVDLLKAPLVDGVPEDLEAVRELLRSCEHLICSAKSLQNDIHGVS